MTVTEQMIATLNAVLAEANALGANGADDLETTTLHRVASGDNGNGGEYSADVRVQVTRSVTQPTDASTKPSGSPTTPKE